MRTGMKHTAGPWQVYHQCETFTVAYKVTDKGHYDVCDMVNPSEHLTNIVADEAMANAHLIAAAPELLEALRVMVDHASEKYPHFEAERGTRDIQQALDAIAKAEGRQ